MRRWGWKRNVSNRYTINFPLCTVNCFLQVATQIFKIWLWTFTFECKICFWLFFLSSCDMKNSKNKVYSCKYGETQQMAGALKIADQCYNYILFRIPLPYSYKSLTRTKHMISSCRATALHVCALISSCIVCVCCSTTYYNRAESESRIYWHGWRTRGIF